MKIKLLSSRSTRYGLNLLMASLLVLSIIVLIEIISAKHNYEFDLTQEKRYSLSPQTIKIFKSLKKKVLVYAFYRNDQPGRKTAQNLLDRYASQSPNFSYRMIDPDRNPKETQKYKIQKYGTCVIECGEKKVLEEVLSEENITNSILKVTQEKSKIIYFLKGHGENAIHSSEQSLFGGNPKNYTTARDELENENYQVKELY